MKSPQATGDLIELCRGAGNRAIVGACNLIVWLTKCNQKAYYISTISLPLTTCLTLRLARKPAQTCKSDSQPAERNLRSAWASPTVERRAHVKPELSCASLAEPGRIRFGLDQMKIRPAAGQQAGGRPKWEPSENKVATFCASLSQNLPTVIGTQPQAISAGLFGSRKWQAAGSGGCSSGTSPILAVFLLLELAGWLASSSWRARATGENSPDQHLLMSHVPTCLRPLPLLAPKALLGCYKQLASQACTPANDGSGFTWLGPKWAGCVHREARRRQAGSARTGKPLTFQSAFHP